MLFVVSGMFRPDADAVREEIHERFNEHLAQRPAPVRFGGPLYDAQGRRCGVMLVIEAHDFSAAERFLDSSPYRTAGLYDRTEIVELRPEIGVLR